MAVLSPAVGGDKLDAHDVINGEPLRTCEVSHPASCREATYPSIAEVAAGQGQIVRGEHWRDVTPSGTRPHVEHADLRVEQFDVAHSRQVEDDAARAGRAARDAMTARAHAERHGIASVAGRAGIARRADFAAHACRVLHHGGGFVVVCRPQHQFGAPSAHVAGAQPPVVGVVRPHRHPLQSFGQIRPDLLTLLAQLTHFLHQSLLRSLLPAAPRRAAAAPDSHVPCYAA